MKIKTIFLAIFLCAILATSSMLPLLPKQVSAQSAAGGMVDFPWYYCINMIPGTIHVTYTPYVANIPFVFWTPFTATFAYAPPSVPSQYFKGLTLLGYAPCIESYYPYIQYGIGSILLMSGAGGV